MKEEPQSLKAAWLALTGLTAVFLFEMLDNSILNVALPTIGIQLHASTATLQWVTGAYAVVFGGLMLAFGAIADRYGLRKMMMVGLILLAISSLATLFVNSADQLIAVRAIMGIAAAMTTPGTMALAFRLFKDDSLRIKAITIISTVGLIGLAIGPTLGGLALSVFPWQALLVINVPIALLALISIRLGIKKDSQEELHLDPIDFVGMFFGTFTIAFALVSPTLFATQGGHSWLAWTLASLALVFAGLFLVREKLAKHPLVDFKLVSRPLVSSGLAFDAASGLAIAGLGYLATLQFQLDWGCSPAHAAVAMIPQVIVLIFGGMLVDPFVKWAGLNKAAWWSSTLVVVGLLVYTLLNNFGYIFVILALIMVAAGMRVVGTVAAMNVLKGLPENRTAIGTALIDTASEVSSAAAVAIAGTFLAAIFSGSIANAHWSNQQTHQFHEAILIAGGVLTALAAALVVWGFLRIRGLPEENSQTGEKSEGIKG